MYIYWICRFCIFNKPLNETLVSVVHPTLMHTDEVIHVIMLVCFVWLSLCVQTFSITDPDIQRREIDGICVFFVLIGVVSFVTQMLQVQSAFTRLIASGILPVPPICVQGGGESHKRQPLFCQRNTFFIGKTLSYILQRCWNINSDVKVKLYYYYYVYMKIAK